MALSQKGLKPSLYHANSTKLVSCDRDDLPALVDEIVTQGEVSLDKLSISESHLVQIPGTNLATDLGPPATPCPPYTGTEITYIVKVEKLTNPSLIQTKQGIVVPISDPRTDGKMYGRCLALLLSHKPKVLIPLSESDVTFGPNPTITPTCLSPMELISVRKMILPILVALDCASSDHVDKGTIADSLHRLVSLWPDGNPPRAALKRVNQVLMSTHA